MSGMSWLKICLVPLLCYAPAFVLVWWSSNIFKPASTGNQLLNSANLESRVREEVGKQIVLRKTTSQAEIQRQISDEIKKEIENQENKIKGDLFGQISFPVVFAIASIFAAFAVKDILTEVLKAQEKEKIKQELKQELITQIVPKAIELNQEDFNWHLQKIESYSCWLEHKLTNIEIAQVIDEFNQSSEPNSKETEEGYLLAITNLFSRSKDTLDKISEEFKQGDLELLRDAERLVFEFKVKGIESSEAGRDSLLSSLSENPVKVEKKSETLMLENPNARMDNIFQVQINLLIVTLTKLRESADASEQSEIDDLIELFKNSTSRGARYIEERGKRFERLNEQYSHGLPPLGS